MKIEIRTHGFDLTRSIEHFVYSQAESSLRAFNEMVVSVEFFMKDINGPKGGIDKQVLVKTRLRTGKVIAIESTRSSLYSAIAVSVQRTKRAVRRTVKKHRRIKRVRWNHLDEQIDVATRSRLPAI